MNTQILFLGYNRTQTRIIDFLRKRSCHVDWTDQKVSTLSGHDLVISFGYRHILPPETLDTAARPALNLHIAYLPWNRGAHPLFWAAHDSTPAGVTIHEMDWGIDTGPICYQRKSRLDYSTETFASAHGKLIDDIESLFEEHADELLAGTYAKRPQRGRSSYKRTKDLPSGFSWSSPIAPTIERLRQDVFA